MNGKKEYQAPVLFIGMLLPRDVLNSSAAIGYGEFTTGEDHVFDEWN